MFKNIYFTVPSPVTHLVEASSHALHGYGFNSQSVHILRLWVQSLIKVGRRSHISVSLPLPTTTSIPKINNKISLVEDLKIKNIKILT